MAAYFGAIEKAPFTAIILITEMVGSVEQVLPMIIATFVSYYFLDLLGGRPIYEALRSQMPFKKNLIINIKNQINTKKQSSIKSRLFFCYLIKYLLLLRSIFLL